ncbi:MAG: hypothetical protein J5959_15010 [Butyrivibrio sp.]|nr:hypothetical protein [Butyrivibrio sp.]
MNFKNLFKKKILVQCSIVVLYILTFAFFHFFPQDFMRNALLKKGFVLLLAILAFYNLFTKYKTLDSQNQKVWALIILVTFFSCLPLLFNGLNGDGHDLDFHVYRIEGILKELRTHHFPARIYSFWNDGYGYPLPIFYGDIMLYFPAFLRLLGFSVTISFKIFVTVINLFTAIIAFKCFEGIFKDKSISAILTFAYCLNPYRMTDLYIRHSVGEYIALMFFPLVAYGFYRIIDDNNTGIANSIYNGLLLGLGMTGIVTSHVLSTTMVGFSLILLVIVFAKKTFRFNSIRSFIIGAISALFASAFFLVPFLDYIANVTIFSSKNMQQGMRIQDQCLSVAEIFTFFSADPNSHVQLTPGLLLMATLIFSLYLWLTQRATIEIKILSALSLFFLILPLNFFPWDALADFRATRILTQIEFPWRYLGIACLMLTLLLGYILQTLENKDNNSHITFISAINVSFSLAILGALVFTSLFAFNSSMRHYGEETTYFYSGTNEYKRAEIVGDTFISTDYEQFTGQIEGNFEEVSDINNIGLELTFHVRNSGNDIEITLPRINYPGYQIVDEQGNKYPIHDSENLLVAFNLPANYDGMIYVTFKSPWYWTLSLFISLLSLCFIISYLCGVLPFRSSRCSSQ